MPLTLTQTTSAVVPGTPASFLGVGGTPPYIYSVVPGGAGGSIDSSTGVYTTPSAYNSDKPTDTVQVMDSTAAVATATILVGTPLLLLCDIIQTEMELDNGRVYLWDQKLMQPTDFGLYIAVSNPRCKPFGNVNSFLKDDNTQQQYVSMQAEIAIDIISRGPAARDRKEEVLLAIMSDYSRRQQDSNSFSIARLPTTFINLSEVDGAAIPYRYRITFNMLYAFFKQKPAAYFDDFTKEVVTDP